MTKRLVSVLALALVLGAALVVSASPALAHGGKRGIVGKSPLVEAAATYIGVFESITGKGFEWPDATIPPLRRIRSALRGYATAR